MLMPAAVLVMVILAAIGADLSHVHMARAGLADLAQTIANDVAAGALDTRALRNTGRYVLDPCMAMNIAEGHVNDQSTRTLQNIVIHPITVSDDGEYRVTVSLNAEVEHIFGKGIPRAGDAMPLHATSTATLRDQ